MLLRIHFKIEKHSCFLPHVPPLEAFIIAYPKPITQLFPTIPVVNHLLAIFKRVDCSPVEEEVKLLILKVGRLGDGFWLSLQLVA